MMEHVNGIVGGIALFILILFGIWHWSVRYESVIKDWWKHALQQPGIKSSRLRFATPIAFVRARLSPHGYFGLQMTAGALALIGASCPFGGIAEDVVTGDPLTIVDRCIAEWFHSHASPLVTQWMLAVSDLHGVVAISTYAALLALYLIWKRNWVWLVCLGATVPGGMLLNVLMKHAFLRARPDTAQALVTVTTYSFPSGHVAGTALFHGLLAAMLISRMEIWRWRRRTEGPEKGDLNAPD